MRLLMVRLLLANALSSRPPPTAREIPEICGHDPYFQGERLSEFFLIQDRHLNCAPRFPDVMRTSWGPVRQIPLAQRPSHHSDLHLVPSTK
jgi:hypothetical protein